MLADWWIFQQAAQLLLQGQSPYLQGHFFNPIWAMALWLPLANLRGNLAGIAWAMMTAIGTVIALRRMGVSRTRSIVALALPMGAVGLIAGNMDWIVLLGSTLNPIIGVWLVILKPQIGLGVILLWIIQMYRSGKWHQLYWLLAPVTLALMIQNAIVGAHPLPNNGGFMPIVIIGFPFGAWLMIRMCRTERRDHALAAMPLLSPYLNVTSIAVWLPLVMRQSRRRVIVIGAIGWLVLIGWWIVTVSELHIP